MCIVYINWKKFCKYYITDNVIWGTGHSAKLSLSRSHLQYNIIECIPNYIIIWHFWERNQHFMDIDTCIYRSVLLLGLQPSEIVSRRVWGEKYSRPPRQPKTHSYISVEMGSIKFSRRPALNSADGSELTRHGANRFSQLLGRPSLGIVFLRWRFSRWTN